MHPRWRQLPGETLVLHGRAGRNDGNPYVEGGPGTGVGQHFPKLPARLTGRRQEREQDQAPQLLPATWPACKARAVRVGVLGGTGPAGSAVAARLAASGVEVVIGSRSEARAAGVVAELAQRWAGRGLPLLPGDNRAAAEADIVVLATPWEGALSTVSALGEELAGKILVSMVNAMVRWGERFVPLLPPTGSVAVAVAGAVPQAKVAGAFHHLPARPFGDLERRVEADVMVFSGDRATTDEVIALVGRIPGLRGLDVGGLGSALAVEALTPALVELNRRYKAQASLRVTGVG